MRWEETTKRVHRLFQSAFALVRAFPTTMPGTGGVAMIGAFADFGYSHWVPVCFFWVRHSDIGWPAC